MLRFFRHPLHRATIVVIVCGGLLGYEAPRLVTEPNATAAVLTAVAILGLCYVAYRAYEARRRRSEGR